MQILEACLLSPLSGGKVPETRSLLEPEDTLEGLQECSLSNSRKSVLRRSDVDLSGLRLTGEEGNFDVKGAQLPTSLHSFGAQKVDGDLRSRGRIRAEAAVLGELPCINMYMSRKHNTALGNQGRRVLCLVGANIASWSCEHALPKLR